MTCESECPYNDKVELKVDGNEIELNPFIQGFIAQTIKGMVSSLRGVDDAETISLEIARKTT